MAFDNRAYLSLSFPQDSGFDSYEPVKEKQFYENVKEAEDEDFPSYENIEGSSESYENIRDPSSPKQQLNYQNLDFIPPPPILKSMPELREESYENVDFQKEIPVYAVPKKLSHTPSVAFEEEAPVYENYDFQVIFYKLTLDLLYCINSLARLKFRSFAKTITNCTHCDRLHASY